MSTPTGSVSWYIVLVLFFLLISIATYSWRRCGFVNVLPAPQIPPPQRRPVPKQAGLSKEQLERLPTFTIPEDAQAEEDGELECAICQDSMAGRRVALLPCGHMFDRDCVRSWLLVKPTCPTCRQVVTEELLAEPASFQCRAHFTSASCPVGEMCPVPLHDVEMGACRTLPREGPVVSKPAAMDEPGSSHAVLGTQALELAPMQTGRRSSQDGVRSEHVSISVL